MGRNWEWAKGLARHKRRWQWNNDIIDSVSEKYKL